MGPNIKIELLEGGQMPTKATEGSAGWDLYAAEDAVVYTGEVTPVRLGFRAHLPPDIEMQIRSRSGLTMKGVIVANAPGTVDSDYRGEFKVLLTGIQGVQYDGVNDEWVHFQYHIKKGDRIAQAVLAWVPKVTMTQVESIDTNTTRGEGGFGSTGK